MKTWMLLLLNISNAIYASTPVWTIAPLTATSGLVPSNVPVGVAYRVTNQSKQTHQLVLDQIPGLTQDTSGTNCKSPFTLASGESCVLKLNVTQAVSGGPIICEQIQNCPNCHLECYQPQKSAQLNITQSSSVAIGDSFGGGKVACLNGGLNNLITTNTDYITPLPWGGAGTLTNATSITDGAENTTIIVKELGTNFGTLYAAQFCLEYEVDSQGNTPCVAGNICYNDWFLPAGNNNTSSGQLNCLIVNKVAIGGFTHLDYWSSTEFSSASAYRQVYNSGAENRIPKYNQIGVRCVRAFTP